MNALTQTKDIITNWQPQHQSLFGEQIIKLNHSLIESGLFSKEAVAKLIENCPLEHLGIEMREMQNGRLGTIMGERRDVSGADTLAAIERGKIWMNIRRIMDWSPEYKELLDQMFAEFEARVPGLSTYKHNLGVLVSSPNAQVLYHTDIQGQGLWQISGTKRVTLYPRSDSFINGQDIEKILLREAIEDLDYQPWFEDYAEVIDLQPGEMITWPLYAPHRVNNHDCLNISVTTEHWTREIWNAYAVHYGNGVLRRTLGLNDPSTYPEGLHVYPKAAAAFIWKKMGKQIEGDVDPMRAFYIDPKAANGVSRTD
jgi:hypothetical protein